MATEFTMPKFGESMEEGTVVVRKKQEGDTVEEGEVVLEIQTDKAVLEVEAPASGVLKGIRVPEGETVPINELLAIIE